MDVRFEVEGFGVEVVDGVFLEGGEMSETWSGRVVADEGGSFSIVIFVLGEDVCSEMSDLKSIQ